MVPLGEFSGRTRSSKRASRSPLAHWTACSGYPLGRPRLRPIRPLSTSSATRSFSCHRSPSERPRTPSDHSAATEATRVSVTDVVRFNRKGWFTCLRLLPTERRKTSWDSYDERNGWRHLLGSCGTLEISVHFPFLPRIILSWLEEISAISLTIIFRK